MKSKLLKIGIYVYVVPDLFLPSVVVGARRQRPSAHTRPPHLTPLQWALWYLVSGRAPGDDEVFQADVTLRSVELTMNHRNGFLQAGKWEQLQAHELPGGCFRITGKTNKI